MHLQKITPCLWFDTQAEDAAQFYCAIFPNSQILQISRYGEAGYEIHRKRAGSILTVTFELDGQAFTALNGGPEFRFNPAISFQVACDNQPELDHYWDALSAGGEEQAQQCGWLQDRYGVSWQIIPTGLPAMMCDADSRKSERVMDALLQMKKLDIAKLQQAFDG